MKELQAVLNNAVSTAKGEDKYAQVKSADLSIQQKGSIKYFYARLSRIYQAEYRRQLPDESTERASKAEFGKLIMNIDKEMMDKGFDALHKEMGNPESDYRFMALDPIIELVKSGGKAEGQKGGAYNAFAPQLPEPIEYKTKRKKAGESSLNNLMGMFDE